MTDHSRRVLVQSKIPPDVKKKLEKAADVEGISTSAYIRRLLMQHVRGV